MMRKQLQIAVALLTIAGGIANGDELGTMNAAGVAIDGAAGTPPRGIGYPTTRISPDAIVDIVDLGAAQRRVPVSPAGEPRDQRPIAGFVEQTPAGLLAAPNWSPVSTGGHTWSVEYSAPDAFALRLRLSGDFGRDGLEVRVYDPVSGNAFGPYTAPRLDSRGDWWTTIIFGSTIGLEFHVPADGAFPPRMPDLTGVARYESPPGGIAGMECTHLDYSCQGAWQDDGRAVCMLAFIDGDGDVVGYCSGALLNRSPSDLAPLVLTANHCITDQNDANATSFVWFYQTDSCNGTPPDPNDLPRSDGSILLKVRYNADTDLVGLYEPPAGDFWLGWDSGGWALQSDAFGIAHPAGSFKRMSFGDVTVALWVTYGLNSAHVWRVYWDSGATEGGSSGSPVLDSSHRVRGALKGGADCDYGDYGRFGVAYETLEPYINNMPSPVFVQSGAGGDQTGTSGNPFNTVYEGTHCVFAGDEIRIRAGNYNEQFRLWRPMRLNSDGGLVRIGQ
ncbi:MAG: trypsin-like peptidase domain-containing protein [Phycisphaerales bacterium]|nr:trypsin-like peptidase domain-containing protein [Phycisphaerales bacterium]